MNRLQQVEFEILKEFICVCEKLNLKYYLVCGSALGAVKYQGFIPWDDDIDVGLVRKDYEIFIQQAPKMLPEYYFVQTHKSDPKFAQVFCKIRDSRTTYIEKSSSELDINHGVYIDIFPLDGYPEKKRNVFILELKKKLFDFHRMLVFKQGENVSLKVKIIKKIGKGLQLERITKKFVGLFEQEISKWNIEDSEWVCNHGNWQGKLEYAPKWHYGKGGECWFEGIKIKVPEKYDAYLTQKYGDWKEDLPPSMQKGHHFYEVCDLEKSYIEYMEKLFNQN